MMAPAAKPPMIPAATAPPLPPALAGDTAAAMVAAATRTIKPLVMIENPLRYAADSERPHVPRSKHGHAYQEINGPFQRDSDRPSPPEAPPLRGRPSAHPSEVPNNLGGREAPDPT